MESALGWALGAAAVYGILAGTGARIGLQTNRTGWWPLLLAVVVVLGSLAGMSKRAPGDVFSLAYGEFGASAMGAVVAVLSFYIAGDSHRKTLCTGTAR